jgi:hypothetical protein
VDPLLLFTNLRAPQETQDAEHDLGMNGPSTTAAGLGAGQS